MHAKYNYFRKGFENYLKNFEGRIGGTNYCRTPSAQTLQNGATAKCTRNCEWDFRHNDTISSTHATKSDTLCRVCYPLIALRNLASHQSTGGGTHGSSGVAAQQSVQNTNGRNLSTTQIPIGDLQTCCRRTTQTRARSLEEMVKSALTCE